ncbi:MAG: hypothetical protein EZS28_015201 [Streblomastix strix]|uniref:Uncharacterized protein n=1 Tax=Streblomastix strix TaxID=222440 RepID=A0A5J4W3I6_9EUKA|nr:MAG: hypothetical protein EZS28_015201 [Streblomastix strix]
MNHRFNNTIRQPLSKDSYQILNYAKFVPQNPLQIAATQPQSMILNTFLQNIQIDPLDTDQMVAILENMTSYTAIAACSLLSRLYGQKISQIDFYPEDESEIQVKESIQVESAASEFVSRRILLMLKN